ncbi:MAG: diaminopimelate epimerase [Desulfobulbaceae bacterium A2]|nr:MAG: diaminopimelate epimerase [Desulfobulbaceae bacterium A2]
MTVRSFVKMSGAGNDFILIDNRRSLLDVETMPDFVRRVCRHRFSVGADGVIFIEASNSADFRWRFYNADGSLAEMCGNGARCAARFAQMAGIAPPRMRFETLAGVVEAEVEGSEVRVRLTAPRELRLRQEITVDGTPLTLHSLDTGVPHAVVLVEDAATAPVVELGRRIRHHAAFAPRGTNVNFVVLRPDGTLKVRTYERGVEDETHACGTGAVAAALVCASLGLLTPPVRVESSGGEQLQVHFEPAPAGSVPERVYLQGPALTIYRGELDPEALAG